MKKRIKIEKIIESRKDYYIAVDIGKRNCVVCVTDKDGSIIEETKYDNTLEEAEERFASHLDKKYSNRKNVMLFVNQQRICGSRHTKHLRNNGIDVKLANPRKTKAIAEARIKTDKLDARILAHLLRSNLIAESYIAPNKIREKIDLYYD